MKFMTVTMTQLGTWMKAYLNVSQFPVFDTVWEEMAMLVDTYSQFNHHTLLHRRVSLSSLRLQYHGQNRRVHKLPR